MSLQSITNHSTLTGISLLKLISVRSHDALRMASAIQSHEKVKRSKIAQLKIEWRNASGFFKKGSMI